MSNKFRDQIVKMNEKELISIFKNQRDYQNDYLEIVTEELKKRGIDINTITVLEKTELEEKTIKKDIKSTIIALRVVAAFLVLAALTNGYFFWQNIQKDISTSNTVFSGVGLFYCVILICISVAIWLKKQWACITALILLLINAIVSAGYVFKYIYSPNIPLLIISYAIILACIFILYSGNKAIKQIKSGT